MTDAAPILAPTLELEDPELGAAEVLDHLGGERRALEERGAHGDLVAVAHHQHLIEAQLLTRLPGEARHFHDLVGHELGLIPVDADDRVHQGFSSGLRGLRLLPWVARERKTGDGRPADGRGTDVSTMVFAGGSSRSGPGRTIRGNPAVAPARPGIKRARPRVAVTPSWPGRFESAGVPRLLRLRNGVAMKPW